MIILLDQHDVKKGFIPNMDLNRSLSDVRSTIIAHHGISTFYFTMFDTQIKTVKEKYLTLRDVITDTLHHGYKHQLTLYIPNKTLQKSSESFPEFDVSKISSSVSNNESNANSLQDSSELPELDLCGISASISNNDTVENVNLSKDISAIPKSDLVNNSNVQQETSKTNSSTVDSLCRSFSNKTNVSNTFYKSKTHKEQTLFHKEEIENSEGLSRAFMTFYNEMAIRMRSDHHFESWEGVASQRWFYRFCVDEKENTNS